MSLLIFIQLLCAFIAALVAISLLATRAMQPQCARILGANFLLYSVQHSLAVAVFSNTWPELWVLRAMLATLLGPGMYGYFLSVLHPNRLHFRRIYFHLLPLGVMVIVLLFGYGQAVDPLIIGSFFAYTSYIAFQLFLPTQPNTPLAESESSARRWLGVLIVIMCINLLTEVGILMEISKDIPLQNSTSLLFGSVAFFAFYILSLILVLTRAPILEWMHELKGLSVEGQKPLLLDQDEMQSLFHRWEALVSDKSLLMPDNAITVSRAARLLGVPSRKLSQAINTLYGASFSQYLNDKRVERAKELLTQEQSLSITEVFLAAGFGTKSQFHREFSRCTGMTPSDFRATSGGT